MTQTTEGTGPGAAGPNRGPGNNRNQYVSLLDPHVIYSGKIYMTSGTGTIVLPSHLRDVPENLTLVVAGKAFSVVKLLDVDGLVESFQIVGAKKANVDFLVIKNPSGTFGEEYFAP